MSIKRLHSPWLSHGIFNSIKNKSKLFKQVKKNQLDYNSYKLYRNNLTNVIRSAKLQYFKHKFDIYKSNLRKTWTTIRDLLNRNKSPNEIKKLVVDGQTLTETAEAC